MSTPPKPRILEVSMDELERIAERAKHEPLSEQECDLMLDVAKSYFHLTQLLQDKTTTIEQLRQLLGRSRSEKTRDVLGEPDDDDAGDSDGPAQDAEDQESVEKKKRKGHGRNGAKDYHGAERVAVPHESLSSGDPCPKCEKGKVYTLKTPAVLVRITGQAPLQATVHELERLRCNLCGEVFTASAPEGIGPEKYDEKSASMIALLKYGSGLPFRGPRPREA